MKCKATGSLLLGLPCLLVLFACSQPEAATQESQQLVREGMSLKDVQQVLGTPDSLSKPQTIFNVESKGKINLQRLYYSKRVVVLINDTVKVSNETERP
jgi:hypothetical protein